MSKPPELRRGSTQPEDMDQNLIVSPPKIISPEGDLIRYLGRAVGPWFEETLIPNFWSPTKKVNPWAWEASGPVGPKNSLGYTELLYQEKTAIVNFIMDIADKLYDG